MNEEAKQFLIDNDVIAYDRDGDLVTIYDDCADDLIDLFINFALIQQNKQMDRVKEILGMGGDLEEI